MTCEVQVRVPVTEAVREAAAEARGVPMANLSRQDVEAFVQGVATASVEVEVRRLTEPGLTHAMVARVSGP
jgi:hypothetical protein